jgi:hypothetical protein
VNTLFAQFRCAAAVTRLVAATSRRRRVVILVNTAIAPLRVSAEPIADRTAPAIFVRNSEPVVVVLRPYQALYGFAIDGPFTRVSVAVSEEEAPCLLEENAQCL